MQRWLNPTHPPQINQTFLALLRHGKTVWNEEGRIQGHRDSPLSTKGVRQVEEWAHFLSTYPIHHIIASDLGRVRETVAILQKQLNNVEVEWNSLLREQGWGNWEGKRFCELARTQGELLEKQIRAGWNFRPPGGESRKELVQRTLPVLQDIILRYPGQQVLIVCHEGIIKSIIYHLAKRRFLPEEKKILQKRDLHLLQGSREGLSIAALNIMTTMKNDTPDYKK